jgi:hypothetical protein
VEQFLPRSGGLGVREVAQTMYTHVSKCKNNKIKGEKIKYPSLQILANIIFS